jgi:hypothetical protein
LATLTGGATQRSALPDLKIPTRHNSCPDHYADWMDYPQAATDTGRGTYGALAEMKN